MPAAMPRVNSFRNTPAHTVLSTVSSRAHQQLPAPQWVCEEPTVGAYMRSRREILGLTQDDVAHKASITVSTLRKWEAGLRNPSIENLRVWCQVLDLPSWMLRKVVSLVLGDMDSLKFGTWPPTLSDSDLDHLELIAGPAYYYSFPHYDLLAANSIARATLPSLVPDLRSPRPTNLVEWLMTTTAKNLIANWEDCATRLVYMLRIVGPGIVPRQRLDEIFNTCNARAPKEFPRLFTKNPSRQAIASDIILLRNPETGVIEEFTYRSLRPRQPIHHYAQLQLAKRTKA